MAELISAQQLDSMRQRGATIKREAREVFSPELTKAMESVASAVEKKRNTDVVTAISGLSKALADTKHEINMSPVIDALKAHTKAMENRPSYQFNINRNSKGQMISVTANPKVNK